MTFPDPPDHHIAEELPGLLAGELDAAATRHLARHLRACSACRDDLVDAAIGFGALRSSRRSLQSGPAATSPGRTLAGRTAALVDDDPLPPLVLPRDVSRPGLRWAVAAGAVAAAAAAVIGLVFSGAVGGGGGGGGTQVASAALSPLSGPAAAGGKVRVTRSGASIAVEVRTTGLPTPAAGHFYEAWLLDPKTNKMMAMGVLAPSGDTTYRVEGDLAGGFSAVDISLQANNGNPAHSDQSVLRAVGI